MEYIYGIPTFTVWAVGTPTQQVHLKVWHIFLFNLFRAFSLSYIFTALRCKNSTKICLNFPVDIFLWNFGAASDFVKTLETVLCFPRDIVHLKC